VWTLQNDSGLSVSTLNSIFAKDEIHKQIEKCGNVCKKRKNGKESTFAELETVLFTWYQQARTSNIPIDETTLREKAKIIATQLNIDNFSATNGWVSRFKDQHRLVFKKLAEESAEVSVESEGKRSLVPIVRIGQTCSLCYV
jgi:hypothetical protein